MSQEPILDVEARLRAAKALAQLALPVSDPASMKRDSLPEDRPATP